MYDIQAAVAPRVQWQLTTGSDTHALASEQATDRQTDRWT